MKIHKLYDRQIKLEEAIKVKKEVAIENIEQKNLVPAMWDIFEMVDLKAQLGLLLEIIEENKEE